MRKNLLVTVTVAAALCGCGKSGSFTPAAGAAKPAADKPKAAAPAAKPGPDFAAWDVEGKKRAWQGSWVVKENGVLQAWTVTGDKVETWDGAEAKTYTLKVDAPCRAQFATDGGVMYPREFAVVDGKLRFRAGGAGYRKGNEAIFCDPSGDVYVLDAAGACTLWKRKFGDWEKAAGECGFRKSAEGAEVFFHGQPNGGEFAIEGDAILSRASFETEAAADHAAAKALRDAKGAK